MRWEGGECASGRVWIIGEREGGGGCCIEGLWESRRAGREVYRCWTVNVWMHLARHNSLIQTTLHIASFPGLPTS